MKIFITGAESFIAGTLISRFSGSDVDVAGCDLSASKSPGIAISDIRNPDLGDLIPEGSDAVVHLAALSREADCKGRLDDWFDINVVASVNVLHAAHRRRVKRFVFASSEWVYDFNGTEERYETDKIDPANVGSEYGLSKLLAESYLRQSTRNLKIELTILRFGIVYGPRKKNWSAVEALLHSVATEDAVRIGSRSTARRFIHVSDVAAAIEMSCRSGADGVFNIQGPRLISLNDILDEAKSLTGRYPEIIETEPDSPSIRSVNVDRAAKLLNWQPKMDISDGMQDCAFAVLESFRA